MFKRTLFCCLLLACASVSHVQAQIAVEAKTLYTMDGEAIKNGVVLVKGDKIVTVGPASEIDIPGNYELHKAEVVTPGLIDAHKVVELAGIYNQEADQDQLEQSDPIQPQLRAIDAYNAREELVKFVMNKGVTTVHTGHGPGAIASGQTMIARTAYNTVEEAVIDLATSVAFTLGSMVEQYFDSPGTRAKGAAMLRQQFIKAQDYAKKRKGDDPLPKISRWRHWQMYSMAN